MLRYWKIPVQYPKSVKIFIKEYNKATKMVYNFITNKNGYFKMMNDFKDIEKKIKNIIFEINRIALFIITNKRNDDIIEKIKILYRIIHFNDANLSDILGNDPIEMIEKIYKDFYDNYYSILKNKIMFYNI